MKHIYIASRFSNWALLLPVRDQIQAMGHVVHGRWLVRGELGEDSNEDPAVFAVEDMEDIRASDLLIIDTHNEAPGRQRGGLYVELGYALGLGRHQVWLVGPQTNVFTYLLKIRRFTTWEEALKVLAPKGA